MSMNNLTHTDSAVVIRAARGPDAGALEELARLDSQTPLAGSVLLAEQDGAIVAAVSGDRAIADPFRSTADLVDLLHLRAAPARVRRPRRRLASRRLRLA